MLLVAGQLGRHRRRFAFFAFQGGFKPLLQQPLAHVFHRARGDARRLCDTLVFLNFYLPTTLAADGIMLTATDEADSTGSKINVGIDGPNGGMRFHEILTIGS